MKGKPLYIPANITLRFEFWKGFGKAEMLCTVVVMSVCMAVVAALKLLLDTDVMSLTFIAAITLGSTITVLQKYENTSVLDYIKRSARYMKEQQQFYYKYI